MRERKSLTNLILLALEKSIDGYLRFEDFIYNPNLYLYGYPRTINKSRLSQAFKRLREGGLIEFTSDKQISLRLTDRGFDRALSARIKLEEGEWDGKWRFVTFDIPEKRRTARDLLRAKLKEWGFERWQKSLWATKKNCTVPLRKFIRKVGINDWVIVLESDNIG